MNYVFDLHFCDEAPSSLLSALEIRRSCPNTYLVCVEMLRKPPCVMWLKIGLDKTSVNQPSFLKATDMHKLPLIMAYDDASNRLLAIVRLRLWAVLDGNLPLPSIMVIYSAQRVPRCHRS